VVAVFTGLVATVQRTLVGFETTLRELPGKVTGFFSGLPGEFLRIGENLITSLADAIASRANSYLREKAQGIAAQLPQWVKDLLGIASPSTVFRDIGYQMMAGLGLGLGDGNTLVLSQLTEQIKRIVAAFADLAGWAAGAGSGFGGAKAVLDPLGEMFEKLRTTLGGLDALAAWMPRPGTVERVGTLTTTLKAVVAQFADLAAWGATPAGNTNIVYAAKAVLDPIGEMAPSIGAAVVALDEIAGYRTALSQVAAGTERALAGLRLIIRQFADFALSVSGEELADALGVTGVIGMLAKGLSELPTVLGAIEQTLRLSEALVAGFTIPSLARVTQVAEFIADLVRAVGEATGLISADLRQAAVELAEAAGPVLELLERALAGLLLMEDYIPTVDLATLDWRLAVVATFLRRLIEHLGVHGMMLSTEVRAAADALVTAAGPALGAVKSAVEVIGAVEQFVPVLSLTALVDRLAVVTAFVRRLIELLGAQAALVDTEVRAAAASLVTAATGALGVVKGAIEAIGAVEKFVPTVSLTQLVDRLAVVTAFVRRLIELLGAQALLVDTEVRTAAGELAAVAGPVLGIVKAAIEAIGAVASYVPAPSLAALDAGMTQIAEFVALLVRRLGEASAQVDTDVQTAASGLAAVAGPAVTLLRSALEMMVTLSLYLPIPDLPALRTGMGQVIGFIQALVERIGAAGTATAAIQPATEAFMAVAGPAMQLLRDGLGLLAALPAAPDMARLDQLMAAIMRYLTLMQSWTQKSVRVSTDVQLDVIEFGDQARWVRDEVARTVDDLAGIGTEDGAGLYDVGYNFLAQLAAGMADGAELVKAQVQATADLLPASERAGTFAGATVAGAGGGGGGAVTVFFTYAPALSLASQREAEEVIAPVLARVLAREARRV